MKIIKENSLTENYTVLTEANLSRIANGHDEDGYVMISACRGDALENPKNAQQIYDENNKRTKSLLTDIQRYKYSYIPVYGGYKEIGSDKASIEKSFIVFPFDRSSKTQIDYNEFLLNMIRLGRKYNQDAILVKKPHSDPQYFNCRTGEFDGVPFKNATLNDAQQEYFTALKGWNDISRKGNSVKWEGKPQRFTYQESYLNNAPYNIMNRHMRALGGELL